ncbi:Man1-Src1p-C-terminal domain-containing protein [Phlebopus sp. FC_14]|nr:Man1-Src1p-C-terminal domain-containing protein [Phlebopus sp. FC_14]
MRRTFYHTRSRIKMSGSRSLTAAQIISQGEYLNTDFDPASLTVSQLLGILGYHNVRFPTPYTKPKLVQLFLDEIKPKAAKLRKERLKRENSVASDDGIKDGITGQLIRESAKGLSTRRSSRRLSRALEAEEVIPQPEPSKRRRSSAQPNLFGPSRTKARATQSVLMEESEPEEEEMPARKDASPRPRRSLADDSGWEDNNIFQSGAESSSPTRPSPARRAARKSAAPRKSRHATSAPPQLSPPSSPAKAPFFQPARSPPPQSKFEPQLPLDVLRQTRQFVTRPEIVERVSSIQPGPSQHQPLQTSSNDLKPADEEAAAKSNVSLFNVSEVESGQLDDDRQVMAVSELIVRGGTERSRPAPPLKQSRSYFLSLLYATCAVVAFSVMVKYKRESASIGYCDTASNTNRALEEFQAHLAETATCNQTLVDLPSVLVHCVTTRDSTPCGPFSLIPLPHPSACTPCPEYATCTQYAVTCYTGYIQRPHPLLGFLTLFGTSPSAPMQLVWNLIAGATNGLPGLGPVALPPHCIEDPKRKRNIGALGKAIEALLGQERGSLVCAGGQEDQRLIADCEGGEAKKWGLEVEVLREIMRRKTAPHLLETYDDTFNEAIQQLVQWGSVVFGEDMSGKRYLAHKAPNLTLICQITLEFRRMWQRWRTTVFGFLAGVCVLYLFKRSRVQRQIEGKRIAELVQIALDMLRNQELAHHTDPVTALHPYLSSLQLRDLILQDEHSISARRKLWDQVERVVEGNANVRANLEEVHGGELRVWRWVGSAGTGPDYRKRVQSETEKGEERVV